MFCFHSSYTAITAQTSIALNHSVTWNDGRVWVLAASISYRTGGIRVPDLNRNFGIGSGLAPRDFFHCIPDLDLELGPLKRWVLGHMCSRCLDNIILPIITREALAKSGSEPRDGMDPSKDILVNFVLDIGKCFIQFQSQLPRCRAICISRSLVSECD